MEKSIYSISAKNIPHSREITAPQILCILVHTCQVVLFIVSYFTSRFFVQNTLKALKAVAPFREFFFPCILVVSSYSLSLKGSLTTARLLFCYSQIWRKTNEMDFSSLNSIFLFCKSSSGLSVH